MFDHGRLCIRGSLGDGTEGTGARHGLTSARLAISIGFECDFLPFCDGVQIGGAHRIDLGDRDNLSVSIDDDGRRP